MQTSGAIFFLGDSAFAGLGAFLIPYNLDLVDRAYVDSLGGGQPNSLSPISFQTTGLPGSRVLKVQYENAGFFEELDVLGTTADSINYQVWLYEGTNEMEIRFGSNSMRNDSLVYFGETGPAMAVIPNYNFTLDSLFGDFFYVTGDSTSPTLVRSTSLDTVGYLNGTPVNGAVFRFTPLTVGLLKERIDKKYFAIYPVPSKGELTIETNQRSLGQQIQVTDISGKIVFTEYISQVKSQINLGHLERGIYFIRIGDRAKRFIIE